MGLLHPVQTQAATSSNLNFQARLEGSDGSITSDGTYNVEFKIYKSLNSGQSSQGVCVGGGTDDCLWKEDYLNSASNGVRVVNGYLTVNLGSITSFPSNMPWDDDLYITMNIGGTGNSATWDGEMSPRLKLTAVPYAFQAKQAEQLQAVVGSFTGTLGFGTLGQNTTYTLPDNGHTSETVCLVSTCTGGAGGSLTSGGTANHLALFNTSTDLGDSLLYEDHTAQKFIGLGTTTNSGLLSIQGAATSQSSLSVTGIASETVPVAVITGGATPGSGADLLDLRTSSGLVASFDRSGNFHTTGSATVDGGLAVTGASTLTYSGNTGIGLSETVSNTGTSGSHTVNANSIALSGSANGGGSNTTNALNFSATTQTGNTFNGLNFGTGFNSILVYNNNPVINGSGLFQNFGFDTATNYSNLQKVTNLTLTGNADIQGTTKVALSGSTGSTLVCQNGTSLLSGCDSTFLSPTTTNFIQNNPSSAQTSASFNIQAGSGKVAATVKGASSQDVADFLLSGGGNAFKIDSTGNITAAGTVNGATISGGSLSGGTFSGGTVSSGTLTSTAVNSLGVTSSAITATGALSVSSGGSGQLTLSSATGDIGIGSNTLNGQTISSAASFTGTLAFNTLGAAGSTLLCQNGSKQISSCSTTYEANNGTDFIRNQTTQQTGASFNIQARPSSVGATIQGASGQDIADFVLSGGGNAFKIDSTGSVTAAGDLTVQGSGGVTIGTSSQQGSLVLQQGNGNKITINGTALSSDLTLDFPAGAGPTDTICLESFSNCGATGVVSGSGTDGQVAFFTTGGVLTSNNFFNDDGSSAISIGTTSTPGTLSVTSVGTASAVYIQGPNSGSSPVAVIQSGGGTSSGDLLDLLVGSNTVSNFDNGGNLTLGAVGSTTATLKFATTGSSNLDILSKGTVTGTGNATFVFPTEAAGSSYTLCTTDTCASSTGSSAYINNSVSLQANANFKIQSNGDTHITSAIEARATQTADLLQFQDSSGVAIGGITKNGYFYEVDPSTGHTVTIDAPSGSISADRTIHLPDKGGTICTTSGNCIGNGGSGDVFNGGQTGPLVLGTDTTASADRSLSFITNGQTVARFDTSNNLFLGDANTAGTSSTPNSFVLQGTGSSTAGTAGATLTINGGAGATSSTGSVGGGLTLQGGAAGGSGNNNGGDVTINGGAKANSGTDGVVFIGSANTSAVSLGSSSTSTTSNGDFEIAANKDLTLDSGTGVILQNYNTGTSGSAASAQTLNLTNANTGAGVAIQGISVNPTNNASPSSGINTINALSLGNATTSGSNVTNGLVVGTGYTDAIVLSAVSGNLISNGNFTVANSGLITLGGTSSLGTGDNNSYLCLNSSNQVASCDTTSTGAPFVQGGNDFGSGVEGVLGLTASAGSSADLSIITNGVSRIKIDTSNNFTFQASSTITALGVSSGTANDVTLAGGDNSANSGTAGNVIIQGGAAGGTTSTGGNVSINGGSGTSTNGAVVIGSSTTSAINLDADTTLAAGVNLTFASGAGNFDQSSSSGTFDTGTGAVGLNGDTTLAANKNLSLSSGTGTITQNYDTGTSGSAASANTLNLTNSNTGAGIALQGISVNPTNSATASSGVNTINALNLANATTSGSNVTNGLVVGTGYTNAIVLGAVSGNLISNTNFTVANSGLITLGSTSSLGSADNTSYLCLNSSNQVATCNTGGTGAAFVQGGNSFGSGVEGVLGLTASAGSSADLSIITNGVSRLKIDTSNNFTFQDNSTLTTVSGKTLTVDPNGADINLGAVSSPTSTGIKLNVDTTVAAGKSITFASGAGNFDQHNSTGTFQTGTGNVSINGDTTIAANKNLSLSSGTGQVSQTYDTGTSGSAASANSLNLTNSNTGAGVALQGISITPTNSATPSSGANTINAINLANATTTGSNVTNGLSLGTGYTNGLVLSAVSGDLIQNSNFSVANSGLITLGGSSSLGSADNTSYLCLNSSNEIATCNTGGLGAAFVQGGNSFGSGVEGVLGLTSSAGSGADLSIITNGVSRLKVDTSNNFTFQDNSVLTTTSGKTLTVEANGADINLGAVSSPTATGIKLNVATTLAAGVNLTFASGAGNFDQSSSSGTFDTGTGAVGLNGDTTLAANKNLSLSSGTGTITQNYDTGTSGSAASANTLNLTNSNTGAGITLQGMTFAPINNATSSSGVNTINALNLANATTSGSNVTNGINLGTGYTNGLVLGDVSNDLITATNFTVTNSGYVSLKAPGTADTDSYLCLNGSGQVDSCSTTSTGTAFVQGGNNFGSGVEGVLGLNSSAGAADLSIVTNGVSRIKIDTSNNFTFQAAATITTTSGNALTLDANGADINIGAASPTANGIKLNQDTTIAAGKSLSFASGAGNFDQHNSTGTFQTGTGSVSINGDTTVAANKSLTFTSGTGVILQNYNTGTSGVAASASTQNLTNANTGAGMALQGMTFVPVNNASPSSGVNTINAVNLGDATTTGSNVTNGINLGTGYTNGIVMTTVSGNLIHATNFNVNNAGNITFATPGTADTTTYLCKNGSGIIDTCKTTGTSGVAFVQGGNSFGNTAVLGTSDANNLQINTAGTSRLVIDQSNNFTFQAAATLTTTSSNALTIDANTADINIGAASSPTTTGIKLNQDTTIAAGKSLTFASGAGNFDQHNSTGTFQTGTGNVSINGDTTIAAGKSLSFASGAGNFDQHNSTGTFQTGTGAVSINGDTTVAANKSLTFTSGTGTIIQNYNTGAAGSAASASTQNLTNANTGAGITLQGANFSPVNNASPSSGVNTVNDINLGNATTGGSNITNGINLGTGYTNGIVMTTVTGNLIHATNFNVNNAGNITFATPGTADTTTYLCKNGSGIIDTCKTTGSSGVAFVQGGNSFNATGVLGTSDANNLQINTAGTSRLVVDQSGNFTFQNATANNLTTAGTGSLNVDSNGGTVGVGNSTATTIYVGHNNVGHTIGIGDGGTSTAQLVAIGSTFTGSTLAIQAAGNIAANATGIQFSAGGRAISVAAAASGAGNQLSITGQQGASGQNGGDFLLQAGAGGSGGTGGKVIVKAQDTSQTATFQIQSTTTNLFTANTNNMLVTLGTGTGTLSPTGSGNLFVTNTLEAAGTAFFGISGNGLTLSSSAGNHYEPILTGTARHQKTITLSPEYPGAVLTPANTGNGHVGTMTSDFCSGSGLLGIPSSSNPCSSTQEHNYYSWTATTATNDYDVWTRWQVPSDFDSFNNTSNVVTFYGWRTSTSSSYSLTFYNGSTSCGSVTVSGAGTVGSFVTSNISNLTGCGTITPGSTILNVRVEMTVGATNDVVRAGEILINYYSKY